MSSNQKTIASYDANVQKWRENTSSEVPEEVKIWLSGALSGVSPTARILEIGSAYGRDAQYLQSLGYAVQCTDATPAFVALLKENGLDARQFNLITDLLTDSYDVIIANAVLVHFTVEETKLALRKVFEALKPGGVFIFSVKQGEGAEWVENLAKAPRFFQYWNLPQIRELAFATGFAEIHKGQDPGSIWLHLVASKASN